jgi:hypothetical protein
MQSTILHLTMPNYQSKLMNRDLFSLDLSSETQRNINLDKTITMAHLRGIHFIDNRARNASRLPSFLFHLR